MTKMKQLYHNAPHIDWTHIDIRKVWDMYDLADKYSIPVDGVVKLVRALMLERLQEDDWWCPRVASGELRSLGGTRLDYDLDIGVAKELFISDSARGQLMLNGDPDLVTVARVHWAMSDWHWFLAARCPDLASRGRYQGLAERGDAAMAAIRQRARKMLAHAENVIDINAVHYGRGKEAL